MNINRRTFLRTTGAAMAGGMLPVWAHASLQLGNLQIDTLSDGNLVLPGAMILGDAPMDDATAILSRYNLATDQFKPDCNVTLLRDGTNTILFDVGAGPNFQSSAGLLGEALAALDVAPEDVTHVLFTHAHPDHLWGVLDDFDDPVFANAQHLIGTVERDYWLDPETPDTIGAERQAFAAGALRYLTAIEGQLGTFDDGATVLPGITARMFPGHTPGHMTFDIGTGATGLTVIGDVIGNHHVGFERPDWHSGSDQNPDLGVQSRVRLLDDLATKGGAVIGYHFPFPGIGTVVRGDTGYRFIPA